MLPGECCASGKWSHSARSTVHAPAAALPAAHTVTLCLRHMPCRTAKRKAQMSLQMRRQLGYSGTGKKDDKKVALLTEDVAEALKEVSQGGGGWVDRGCGQQGAGFEAWGKVMVLTEFLKEALKEFSHGGWSVCVWWWGVFGTSRCCCSHRMGQSRRSEEREGGDESVWGSRAWCAGCWEHGAAHRGHIGGTQKRLASGCRGRAGLRQCAV